MKKKQVIITFQTTPIIFDIEPTEINKFLFGKQKKGAKKR